MERCVLRCCKACSALTTAAILFGCSSRSPFVDVTEDPLLLGSAERGIAADRPAAHSSRRAQEHLPLLNVDATLSDYVRYAALNNPGLEAMLQDWIAAVERVPQVGALPDPRLTYGYYLGEVETRVGPMQHSLTLSQTFPWFGKLRDRTDAAARHANAAYQRLEAASLELRLTVERAFNDLYFLSKSINISRDNIELLLQIERVARARYQFDAAGHPDIIRVQVELASAEDRLRQLEDLRGPYTARLNAALNRPADALVPWPGAVSDRVTTMSIEALSSHLEQHNPELLAMDEEIERERIGADIARKDGLPEFTVGLAYTVIDQRSGLDLGENGDDALLATLSLNLPIWREKYDAGVREAVSRRLATAGRRSDSRNQLRRELHEALFEHHDAQRRVGLYRDTLIPKSEESLQASLGGFQQGESDFFDLIETQQTLLEFQIAFERALVDRATSYALIERLIGGRIADVNDTTHSSENSP